MSTNHERTKRQKSTLICPDCGHESPVDGDWNVSEPARDDRRVYRCPDCGAVVVAQPVLAVTA